MTSSQMSASFADGGWLGMPIDCVSVIEVSVTTSWSSSEMARGVLLGGCSASPGVTHSPPGGRPDMDMEESGPFGSENKKRPKKPLIFGAFWLSGVVCAVWVAQMADCFSDAPVFITASREGTHSLFRAG